MNERHHTMTSTPSTWASFSVHTKPNDGYPNPVHYVDVTPQLREAARGDHSDGLLHVFLPHTTATLIFNSGVDGTTLADIRLFIEQQVPVDRPFVHLHDGPQDAAAHVRCVFGTQSLTLPVIGGELGIGMAQGVYLLEMDGPRDRTIQHALQVF
jgi:secondary thiamine-phosphate synthase enzyme